MDMHIISSEGKIGIVIGLLALAGGGAIMVFPDQLLIGWAMIAVAVIGGIWLALFHFEVNRLKTAIAIAVGIAMWGCAAWYYWPSIQDNIPYQTAIAREFKLARTPSLGNPLRGIETTTDAYMAAHEHAMIIFLPPLLEMIVLPNTSERKAKRQPISSYHDDRKWFDDEYLQRVFDPPQDGKPPEYRVAELWYKDPAQWKWIGWREWSCFWALNDKFYYQEFENGIILGVFPTGETISESQIFTITNNGVWSSRISSSVGAPACDEKTLNVNGVVIHGHFTKLKVSS